MHFVKQHKYEFLICLLLTIVFIFTRLFNIMSLPIFTDEAIYIRWSQIAKQDAAWRFISLTDGKQPTFVWFTIIFMKFIEDPLLAGRLVSVVAGLATAIGLFFVARELFRSIWVGFIACTLYVVFPFALLYDRMALYDSLVTTFVLWSFYLAVLLVRKPQLATALLFGMVSGMGILTKTNAFFSMYLLPTTILLFDWTAKKRFKRFLQWVGFALIGVILANIYYSILRLSPFFHIITEKNAIFVYLPKEWLLEPFRFFWGNLTVGLWNWVYTYFTWPVLLLIPLAFLLDWRYIREKIVLFLWFLLPFISLALFGRVLYPRFILFMVIFLLPLIAFSLFILYQKIRSPLLFGIGLIIIFSLQLRIDYLLLVNPAIAPITRSDADQYIKDWPSGVGIKESVAFFAQESRDKKIAVWTQGTFGLLPYAFEIYLVDNPNIIIKGIWPVMETPPAEMIAMSKKMPTYVVFYQPCNICLNIGEAPPTWPVNLVLQFPKINYGKFLTVYRVTP